MAKDQSSTTIRALQVLECFMDAETEWTLKALVKKTGLATTTAYRQLTTLTEQQYLEQDPVRKSYRVGPRLLMLSGAILGQNDLRTLARPEMERLSEKVQETVNLSSMLEEDIFYLDKVEAKRSIACNTRVGSRVPAYGTSSGKIMLAYQTDQEVDTYLAWMKDHAVKLTKNTVTNTDILRSELIHARQMGYATEYGETESGLMCVAAPILNGGNQVVGAISASGPDYRMQENQDVIIEAVRETARNVSYLLGHSVRR